MTPDWTPIERHVARATGRAFRVGRARAVGGGCINRCFDVAGDGERLFVKLNEPGSLPMFEAEAEGLNELRRCAQLAAPRVVCVGGDERRAWLVLEYLDLSRPSPVSMRALGRGLAALHSITAERFGWRRDNFIGSTPQENPESADWPRFFADHRLRFQLRLAERRASDAGLVDNGYRLADALGAFFVGHHPAPSLLHGDLWGGNAAADAAGNPVLFDPAVYYGDRETDIAMTRLFGGFESAFYRAYEEVWPPDHGFEARGVLYNLYHVLNHLNLFGSSYAAQADGMIRRLLAEAG